MPSSSAIEAIAYAPAHRDAWDAAVDAAPRTHFFFRRGFMEYHADRHADASVLLVSAGRIRAVLPASREGALVVSHAGLTYGGLVAAADVGGAEMLALVESLLAHLRAAGVATLRYKALPWIFGPAPCEDDLYALHRAGARLVRRELSSVLSLEAPRHYSKGKRHNLAKARRADLAVTRSDDFAGFVDLLEAQLAARHDARPVHTAAELAMLASRFPDQVHLHVAMRGEELLAGALVFVNPGVLHMQYLACSDAGRECGALDSVIDELIVTADPEKRWLSFGISTEEAGARLNEGLLHSKEAFGARGLVHDCYEVTT
jgi:hypothetical protein